MLVGLLPRTDAVEQADQGLPGIDHPGRLPQCDAVGDLRMIVIADALE